MSLASQIAKDIISPFIKEEYDELYLVYNEFRNGINAEAGHPSGCSPFLRSGQEEDVDPEKRIEYIYEPSDEQLLGQTASHVCASPDL